MKPLDRHDYAEFHASTGREQKDAVLEHRTDRDPAGLSDFERKQEFYGLLKNVASPGIVAVVNECRKNMPLGLIREAGDGTVESSVDDAFLESVAAARREGNAMEVANILYRTMRKTLELSGTKWRDEMILNKDEDYYRLDRLMEKQSRLKYGKHPVAKRVVSATAQTASVALGFQELSRRLYEKKFATLPTPEQMVRAHQSGLRIIMLWADFNRHQLLGVESKIRMLRDDHEAIEPLHANGAFAIEADATILFTGASVLESVAAAKPNTAEGRFGCPGKKFIPQLWEWTEEVSAEHGLIKMASEESAVAGR